LLSIANSWCCYAYPGTWDDLGLELLELHRTVGNGHTTATAKARKAKSTPTGNLFFLSSSPATILDVPSSAFGIDLGFIISYKPTVAMWAYIALLRLR
jgi:hypothetical protein